MEPAEAARFREALRSRGLALDAEDEAAALAVFRYLEEARSRLEAAEREGDGPR